MEIITSTEQSQLIAQQNLRDFYTNDYLNDKENENYKTIAELFFNNNLERVKKFNVWTNMFSTVTDTISYFVWTPDTDLDIDMSPYVKDLVSVWQAVFWIKRVNDILEVYHIPAQDYLNYNWEHKVITLYSNLENDEKVYYQLIQIFQPWKIINKLYQVSNLLKSQGDEVPLDTIPQTAGLQNEQETWLDVPSIFIASVRDNLWGTQSELDKIKSTVYSLDRKQVMFETQFLQEVEQYKIFDNIQIPESAVRSDGTIDINKLGKILATDSSLWQGWDIKFVSNKNNLIQDAIEYQKTQIRNISSTTAIPVSFLWIEDSVWALSWTSRSLLISNFVKKIESYRKTLGKVLADLLETFEGERNKAGDEITTSLIWGDILAKDDKELIEELRIAREAGLISQETWIRLYLGLNTEEEVQNEIEKINSNDITDGEQREV